MFCATIDICINYEMFNYDNITNNMKEWQRDHIEGTYTEMCYGQR